MESQVDSFDSLGSFGQRNFGHLELGDKRRTTRLVETVDLMCRHPGGTLPDKLNRPADLRAFYRLMRRPEVTHEVLIRSHADYTRARIGELAEQNIDVLILHDATELDFTSRTTVSAQLSHIGMGTRRGYICHNSLAVRADTGAVLGLTSQILHQRARVPAKETPKECRERLTRESRLWVHGAQASGPAPAGAGAGGRSPLPPPDAGRLLGRTGHVPPEESGGRQWPCGPSCHSFLGSLRAEDGLRS